jgi:molybdate transport system substrate-binding protein
MLMIGVVFGCRAASAAEVTVLTAGAFRPIVSALAPAFERLTGDTLVETHDTAGALLRRIEGGERFDLVILTAAAIRELTDRGIVASGKSAGLARVGIGVAVKDGTAFPPIDTVDAFTRAMLGAPSVAYIDPAAGGSSGVYLDQLFQRLGIADAVKAKAVLVQGGLVADRLVTGEATVGLQQISELRAVKGVRLVGPLPAEIQTYTLYAGGIGATSGQAEAAQRLLSFLQSEAALGQLKKNGMESPRD